MHWFPGKAPTRNHRRARQLRPSLLQLERRTVPSQFPQSTGISIDPSGDVFLSYDASSVAAGQRQAVAEFSSSGFLINASVFLTTGPNAVPGFLTTVGASATLPRISSPTEILELQPDGELFAFNPSTGANLAYDALTGYTPSAASVYDVQTGAMVDLSSTISLATATYGDFGVYGSSLVIAAESNNWDFVMRLTYGSGGAGVATVLAASPISAGLSATPGGVAVDSQGTVLTTLPDLPSGATTAIHVPVGFSLFYDQGQNPQPSVLALGLASTANIDSNSITVDSQNNFLLALKSSSLYGGGPGIAHVNSALNAFLADPTTSGEGIPTGIAYQNVAGTNTLAFTNPAAGMYTQAGELSLFSGQVTPAQLRHAYGIDQIQFPGAGGTTVTGDGTGQTIAIVEEGVDPTLQADLHTFDQFFGIPDPPSFKVVNQGGVTNQNLSIVGEASLDVEWAHATAPGASIVVYDAAYYANDPTTSLLDLFQSMQLAAAIPGVSVVTLSYGIPESDLASLGITQQQIDSDFTAKGVTFLASSGDSGAFGNGGNQFATNYPASSPNVVAVGGTSLTIDAAGDYPGTGPTGEVGWGAGANSNNVGGSGGGLSTVESEPSWQTSVVSLNLDSSRVRAVPDVSIDSGSAQPYDVFTSTLSGSSVSAAAVGWLGDAGTSASSPIWAGLIAIADQGRALQGGAPLTGSTQTLPALYSLPASDFHDIVNGNNGYSAGPGYDLVTGLGTPVANLLVPDLAGSQIPSQLFINSEPTSVAAGATFVLKVEVEDRLGTVLTGAGGTVTVALGNNPGNSTLGGTLTVPVVNGVATFSDLTLSAPGSGYTLTLTASAFSATQTTTAITVNPPTTTGIVVTASPAAPVYGQAVTLTATVVGSGSTPPTGTVTFTTGTTSLGTAALSNGVASVSTTPSAAGTESITVAYGGDTNNPTGSVTFVLNVGQATTTLTLGNLAVTYDGSPHTASVTTSPAGLTGVSLTITQNGVTVASPTHPGSYTVTATLSNPNYTAPTATGTLVISQATPTLTWATPADITAGTALGPLQLDAAASFNGTSLAGTYAYSPAAFTVLGVGNGQTLQVTFTPANSTDFTSASSSVLINVVPQPTPTPTTPSPTPTSTTPTPTTPTPTATTPTPTVPLVRVAGVSIQSTRTRKTRSKVIDVTFSGQLSAASADNLAAYTLSTVAQGKKHKSKPVPLSAAIYSAATNSVMLIPRHAPLSLSPPLILTINGASLVDSLGRQVDASGSGQPGGSYTGELSKSGVSAL